MENDLFPDGSGGVTWRQRRRNMKTAAAYRPLIQLLWPTAIWQWPWRNTGDARHVAGRFWLRFNHLQLISRMKIAREKIRRMNSGRHVRIYNFCKKINDQTQKIQRRNEISLFWDGMKEVNFSRFRALSFRRESWSLGLNRAPVLSSSSFLFLSFFFIFFIF